MRRHLVARVVLDEPVIEPLVEGTLDGEKRARADLWLALSPVIEKIAGQWRVTGRLHDREDDRRDVVVSVMGRLEARRFQRLETFHGLLQRRNGTASVWFRSLTVRAALRHVESHPDHLGAAAGEGGSRWASLVPFSDVLEEGLAARSLRVIEAITAHAELRAQRSSVPLDVGRGERLLAREVARRR